MNNIANNLFNPRHCVFLDSKVLEITGSANAAMIFTFMTEVANGNKVNVSDFENTCFKETMMEKTRQQRALRILEANKIIRVLKGDLYRVQEVEILN